MSRRPRAGADAANPNANPNPNPNPTPNPNPKPSQVLSLCKGLHLEGGEIVPLTARIAAQTGYAASILAGPNLYSEMARDG